MATTTTSGSEPNPLWKRLLGRDYDFSIFDERERRAALTAASMELSTRKIDRGAVAPEAWQKEAIELYSEVGELRYVANAQANVASRAEFFVGKWNGEAYPEPVEDDRIRLIFDLFGGGPLGRAELIKRLYIQLFVPGDGYILGLPPGILDDGPTIETGLLRMSDLSWHVLAATEVAVAQDKVSINRGDKNVTLPRQDAVIVRAWRPNPFRWWQADSPVRSNLPVLRELVGLTKHVSANIDSRLAGAGVLLIGDSFSLMAGQSPDPDDTSEVDPVMASLMDAMLTSIKDRDAASAVVPIMLRGPDEAIDKVRHLTFSTPFDAGTKELRDEAIRRLALGLDAPPEVLLGLGTSTHWNAWIIQDDTIRSHVDPALALICDALTQDYLWPMLEDNGVQDFRDYAVWWDTTELTQRSDRSQEAIQLFQLGQLSPAALRRETGFDDNDAPEAVEQDVAVETALQLVTAAPSLIADPGLPMLVAQLRDVLGVATEDAGTEIVVPLEPDDVPDAPEGNGPPDTLDDPEEPPVVASSYQVEPGQGILPEAYRPALEDDVPEGRACGNCVFYDETRVSDSGEEAWCELWAAFVRGDHYCDRWQGAPPTDDEADDADGDD